MTTVLDKSWLDAFVVTLDSHRRMIDSTVQQLSDAELHAPPAPGINSVAIILRHLGGNLQSRWTNFLTTDGEKPERNRDAEFHDWEGDRTSLMAHFEAGWSALVSAVRVIDDSNINQLITIRGENHTIEQALVRSITHVAYHVGQMAMIARMVHKGQWQWLTIPPGESELHNLRTWGTAESRSTHGDNKIAQ